MLMKQVLQQDEAKRDWLQNKLRLSGHGKNMTVTTMDNSPIFHIVFRGGLSYVVLKNTGAESKNR